MTVNTLSAASAYAAAAARAGAPGLDARAQGEGGFAALLGEAARGAADTLYRGEATSLQAIAGKADIADVVTAVNSAEVTLQTVLAVRDRMVEAYQEILRMPI